MGKNITTRLTIQRLAEEVRSTFAKKSDLSAISSAAAAALKSGLVEGNTVKLFTSADKTGEAAFSFDFPVELFLDQTRTEFVPKFTFSETAYPGAADPGLGDKPVMVLAVKGDGALVTYSFLDMAALVDTYAPKAGDGSATVTVAGYEISVNVNVSTEANNALVKREDGSLYVPKPAAVDISGKADRDADAVEGNLAQFDAEGNPTDSGVAVAQLVAAADIRDYTVEEIAALLAGE